MGNAFAMETGPLPPGMDWAFGRGEADPAVVPEELLPFRANAGSAHVDS